jgi:hypothetical protein
MSQIVVANNDLADKVRRGEAVFRIISYSLDGTIIRDLTVLNTYDNVRHLVQTHRYMPLLYTVELPMLIAYLYGCLNLTEDFRHDVKFVVMGRLLGEREEAVWFTVFPYYNSI